MTTQPDPLRIGDFDSEYGMKRRVRLSSREERDLLAELVDHEETHVECEQPIPDDIDASPQPMPDDDSE